MLTGEENLLVEFTSKSIIEIIIEKSNLSDISFVMFLWITRLGQVPRLFQCSKFLKVLIQSQSNTLEPNHS